MDQSEALFEKAKRLIPGGVNSPVRAFKAVGGAPRFIQSGAGSRITDVDGREYIDYVCSWGCHILGHAHEKILSAICSAAQKGTGFGAATESEIVMAELICGIMPSIQMVRMVNSGTEAVMSAIRLARGFTGKTKIIKFEGCYHGHSDSMLVKAGSGVLTAGIPDSLGVPSGCAADTLTAVFNDIESVAELFSTHKNEIAAVIIELIPANMGLVLPDASFLHNLKKLCEENNALLIADEVITGFRIGLGGAQEYFGITPDITTLGKIIGGGLPVGAYGGRREIMECVLPVGGVYQAGTLSGNPIAMAAGIAAMTHLRENPQFYEELNRQSRKLTNGLNAIIAEHNINAMINSVGSLFCLFFSDTNVRNYAEAKTCNTVSYGKYFHSMLERGIYIAPSQYEAAFLSSAHTDFDIAYTLESAEIALKSIGSND